MTVDPKALTPGTRITWRGQDAKTLSHRKKDDSGWWLTDGTGLVDWMWESGDWTVTEEATL